MPMIDIGNEDAIRKLWEVISCQCGAGKATVSQTG